MHDLNKIKMKALNLRTFRENNSSDLDHRMDVRSLRRQADS